MDLDVDVLDSKFPTKVYFHLDHIRYTNYIIDDNLWDVIDRENVQCLNEQTAYSCKTIFRMEERRLDWDGSLLESPSDDPELILIIP